MTGAAGPSCLDAATGKDFVPLSNLPPMISVILLLSVLSVCAQTWLILQPFPHFWPIV